MQHINNTMNYSGDATLAAAKGSLEAILDSGQVVIITNPDGNQFKLESGFTLETYPQNDISKSTSFYLDDTSSTQVFDSSDLVDAFHRFEAIKHSGITNMFDRTRVCALAGITTSQYHDILNHYNELSKKYGGE